MRGGLAMVSRILGAVLSVVLVAASGFGGYVGMKAVVDKVEAEVAADPVDLSAGYAISNGAFTIRLPGPAEVTTEPFVVGSVTLTRTKWTGPDEKVDPYFGVAYVDYAPLGAAVTLDQAALHGVLAAAAERGSGTLIGEEEFTLGADPARRGVVDLGGGFIYLTAVAHATRVVMVLAASESAVAPPVYDDVVASLQWSA
jgi:hypothetical protein